MNGWLQIVNFTTKQKNAAARFSPQRKIKCCLIETEIIRGSSITSCECFQPTERERERERSMHWREVEARVHLLISSPIRFTFMSSAIPFRSSQHISKTSLLSLSLFTVDIQRLFSLASKWFTHLTTHFSEALFNTFPSFSRSLALAYQKFLFTLALLHFALSLPSFTATIGCLFKKTEQAQIGS